MLKNHLLELDLSYNSLRIIPEWFAELESLQVLNLTHNCLEAFPPCLPGLRKLFLTANPYLKLIPTEFKQMTSLEYVALDAKNIANMPVEIVSREPEDIRKYLEDLQRGHQKCYRIKLMIVGEEAVGKV